MRNASPEAVAKIITEDIMLSAVDICGKKTVLYEAEYNVATQVYVNLL